MHRYKILIFLLLSAVCFAGDWVGDDMIFRNAGEGIIWTNNSQTVYVYAHPSASESYELVWPAAKGTAGQPLIIDSIVSDVITLDFATASSVVAHDVTGANHGDAKTVSVVRGDIMYGNSDPLWDRLPIGAANTFLKSDGTDVDWGFIDISLSTNLAVTTPITLTGDSVGIVNQGTTTTVLHGDAAGNASFGIVDISDDTNLTVDTDHFLLNDDEIDFSVNQDTNVHVWQGSFLEQHDFTITVAGGTVTGNLEKEGTGDLTMYFSDEFTTLDCTAPLCTVDLTARVGTDASPAEAFVYIPLSTKTLTAAASWPAASVLHIRVANIVLQSAATTGTDGALQNRNWNDFAFGITDPRGHGLHITQNIRANHAKWLSGVVLTVTGDGTGTITLDNSAGVVSQVHEQTFPALDMAGADDIHIVNQVVDEGGNYETSVNLVADVTHFVDGTDSGTAFVVNRYFNVVIWGVQNRTGETSHLMLNLPTGQYTSESGAKADGNNFSVKSIPSAFTGTGFLIAELTFRLTGGGGTWTLFQEKSLLGIAPGTTAGGGVTTTATMFSDASFAVFDNGDDSKRILFEASSIATGNDRTITMANVNVDLADITLNNIHRADNSQAHSDYLINNDNDTTTGVLTVEGLGTGGQTDYDLKVGDTDGSPTYGMIQMGNSCIGRTSFTAGNIDLDGSMIYRNIAGPVTSEIEHVFVESTGDTTRFALAKSGVGNATYNSRSMFLAGPAPADTDYVKVSYWQGQGIFDNLACDTSGTGADFGIQNDLEVEGDIFTDSIKESTTDAGISFNDFDIPNVGDIALDTISADDGSSFSISNDWTNAGNTIADLGSVTTTDINGGTINGITDLAVADGGTGASNAGDARTNLGLVIGTNVQAWDADLDTLATMQAGAPAALQVLTATEIAFLDGADPDIVVANKAVVADGSGDIVSGGNITALGFIATGDIAIGLTSLVDGSLTGGASLNIEAGASGILSTTIRDDTTAFSANVFINSVTGQLFRSTSSARRKTGIIDIPENIDPILRPRRFYSTSKGDDPNQLFYGLIAEEVYTVLPEAVVMHRPITDDSDPNNLIYGEPEPDAIDWNMITTMIIKQNHWLKAQLQALEQRVTILESR